MNRKNRYANKIIGKDISFTMDTWASGHNNNVCCIAGSGHGKTTGFVEPNLLENERSSIVVADTKGQLYRKYSDLFRAKGYNVFLFDLATPEHSNCYNPLRYIRRHPNGRPYEQDIMMVASMLQGRLDAHEAYWDNTSADYIAFLIDYILESDLPKEEQTLPTLCMLHTAFLKPHGSKSFLQWARENPNTLGARKLTEIEALRSSDRTFACIMSFASTALSCLGYVEAEHLFVSHGNDIDLKILGREKTILFVNSSDTDFTFTKIASLLYTQLFQVLTAEADISEDGVLSVPVDIFLDDFCCSASAIQDFDRLISVIRSRDISVNIMLQSMTQLESMYGADKARTIVDNCDTILYMGCNSQETAEFIGSRASKTPDNILNGLTREQAWFISSGEKARLIDKIMAGSYSIPEVTNVTSADSENTVTPFHNCDFFVDDELPFD